MDQAADLPSLSIVVESSTSQSGGTIQFADSAAALRAQDYPPEKLEIVAVVYGALEPYLPVLERLSISTVVVVPDGTGYYEAKRRGVERTRGEIVGFVDADNLVATDWARHITAPFLARPDVMAVLGRHSFRRAPFSGFWDMFWWDRSFEREGPIDKLGAANNVAFRREVLETAWYPDVGRARGTWERAMTDAIRRRGALWLAPAAQLTHDYSPEIGNQLQRAYARGYNLLATRRDYPRGIERRLGSVRWLVPWVAFPALVAKDVRRVLERFSGAGYNGVGAMKLPVLLAAVLIADIVSLAGMLRSLRRTGSVEPP